MSSSYISGVQLQKVPFQGDGPSWTAAMGGKIDASFTNVGVIADLRNCQLPALITGALNVPNRDGTIYSVAGRVNVGIDMGPDPATPLVGSASGVISIDPGVTTLA